MPNSLQKGGAAQNRIRTSRSLQIPGHIPVSFSLGIKEPGERGGGGSFVKVKTGS